MTLRSLLTGIAVLLPLAAQAESGFYIGGGLGGSRVEQDVGVTAQVVTVNSPFPPVEPDPTIEIPELKGTDFAYKAFAGYRLGRFFAVEGGYVNLGRAEDSYGYTIPAIVNPPTCPPDQPGCTQIFFRGDADREIEVYNEIDGWQLSVLGIWPFHERAEVYARAGAFFWDAKGEIVDRLAETIPVQQPGVPAIKVPALDNPDPNVNDLPIRASDDGTALAIGAGISLKVTENVSLRGEAEWFDVDDTDLVWIMTAGFVVQF